MKKFFSLVLALVMALSLTTMAWGATPATELPAAVDGVITLTEDVTLTFSGSSPNNIALTNDIDGNGFTLTLKGAVVPGSSDAAFYGTDVIIEDLVIVNELTSGYVFDLADAALVNVDITGGELLIAVNEGDTLSLEDCEFECTGTAIVMDETCTTAVQIEDCEITADYAVIFYNDDCSSVGSTYNAKVNFYAEGSAANAAGNTFNNRVKLYNDDEALNGNSFGATGVVALDSAVDATSIDLDGNYWGGGMPAAGQVPTTVTVNTYAAAVAANGTVGEIATSSTTPVGAVVYFYAADNSTTGWAKVHTFVNTKLSSFAKDADDNCLPCYYVAGDYYVEVPEASASYKLVYGASKVFLAPVAEKVVKYADDAVVLTVVEETDAECGDYYVADAIYDEDDVYYVSYDKKGLVDGIWVAAKNGGVQLLVNGKIVNAKAAPEVEWLLHTWVGNDIVNNQYTTAKCTECGKVAKLYANGTAAGKNAVLTANGYIAAADYYGFGAVVAPSTDKVESAETFDAGIAMYVGMSVMAAAGSAVVLKKKD